MNRDIYWMYLKIRQDMIKNGIIFNAGRIAKLEKEEIAKAIGECLEIAREFRQPDVGEVDVNGKRVWVNDDGCVITLMLPEDVPDDFCLS